MVHLVRYTYPSGAPLARFRNVLSLVPVLLPSVPYASTERALSAGDIPFIAPSSTLEVDGQIQQGEWPDAAMGSGFSDSETNLASDEEGVFWITADTKFIYFAGRVRTDPKKLVDEEYRSNVNLRRNDNMRLAIDPHGTNQNFNNFAVNPRGATSLELAGGRAAKTEWLGEFEAFGRRTETGWEFEARIPWGLMDLPAQGTRDLRFNVSWFRSNKANSYSYVYTGSDNTKIPRWTAVPVPPFSRARTVELLPFGYIGATDNGDIIAEGGIDMKSELGSGITGVATINPDFRNVENGILSIDPSFFERLADDGRAFFQEGSRFRSLGFDSRIFASQRVEAFDTGVNFYGKVGPSTNASLLSTVDFGVQQTVVGSLQHQIDERRSFGIGYVGNFQRGLDNDAINLSFNEQRGSYLNFGSVQFTDDQQRKSGHRINLGVFRRGGAVSGGFEVIQISPDFFPRIGFNRETNLRGLLANREWVVQPDRGTINEYGFEVHGLYYDRMTGGEYRREIGAEFRARTNSGIAMEVQGEISRFEGFDDVAAGVQFSYPVTDPYRGIGLSYDNGSFRERRVQIFGVSGSYRPMRQLQLSMRNEFVSAEGENEVQQVLSWTWDIGRFEAIGGRLVRRDDDVNWYLSYRLSGKRGNEWFLILGDPNARTFQPQIIIKAVIPLTIRL